VPVILVGAVDLHLGSLNIVRGFGMSAFMSAAARIP
jgi:hypothetical protein